MTTPKKPTISVVMVDGSFRERFHLLESLAVQTVPPEDFEVLWVEYYDRLRPDLEQRIRQNANSRPVLLGRDGVYHSSYCFNAGIRESRGELIVIPDADVVVEDRFLETIWQEHQANEKLVMYIHRLDEPMDSRSDKIDLEHLREACVLQHPSNYGGCLTTRKRWLLKINGYEQHPVFATGMHANGLDVFTRFKNLGLHIMWHPDLRLYHPWHPLTKTWVNEYRLQKFVIGHRAVKKESLSYCGIDDQKDRPMPPDLEARIRNASRPSRVLIHRAYSRLMNRLG